MTPITRRHAAVAAVSLALAVAAGVAGLAASMHAAHAQPSPSLLSQQPPSSCVCAPPTSVFGSGGAQIAHCQCGALQCAAVNATGGVVLQCAR